jgi:hypothetical protein
MNAQFSFDGTIYTVRNSPDWSILVNRLITKRFGAAAAKNRQDIENCEWPDRMWRGMIDGRTYEIREVKASPEIMDLAKYAANLSAALQAHALAQDKRDQALREASRIGSTAAMLSAAAGISLARAYQIRDNRR